MTKVAAACLDVYEEEGDLFYEDCSEEIVADDTLVRLISMPNVIVTSHQAFLAKEALGNIAATTVDNLLKFARGEPSPETEVCYHCAQKEPCRAQTAGSAKGTASPGGSPFFECVIAAIPFFSRSRRRRG